MREAPADEKGKDGYEVWLVAWLAAMAALIASLKWALE